jgi:hypothetical protein
MEKQLYIRVMTKRSYGSFEEMKKGTSAIHGTTFFYQKGHGATPFYFSLDKTLLYPGVLNVCLNPLSAIYW